MLKLREYQNLKKILGNPSRSSKQLNSLFHSDCEILKLDSENFLATSMDSISEEISLGLYQNPATWAWLCISSSVGDLAASGTTALGVTVSTQWKFGSSIFLQKLFYKQLNKACKTLQMPLLGGDSGSAQDHCFTSSVLGTSSKKPLSRHGAFPGDFIILAHQKNLGVGPALAFSFLKKSEFQKKLEKVFRPKPSWKLSEKLRPYCHSSIDTSDGLMTSLLILSQLNRLGFQLQWKPEILHPLAKKFCQSENIHPLSMWFGDLGDGQLIYAVSKRNLNRVLNMKCPTGTKLTVLGRFTKSKSYQLQTETGNYDLPMNILNQMPRDTASYKKYWKKISDRFYKEFGTL